VTFQHAKGKERTREVEHMGRDSSRTFWPGKTIERLGRGFQGEDYSLSEKSGSERKRNYHLILKNARVTARKPPGEGNKIGMKERKKRLMDKNRVREGRTLRAKGRNAHLHQRGGLH